MRLIKLAALAVIGAAALGTAGPASASPSVRADALSDSLTTAFSQIETDDGTSVLLPDGDTLFGGGDTLAVNGQVICSKTSCPYGYPHDIFVTVTPSGTVTPVSCSSAGCPYGWQEIPNASDGSYYWISSMGVYGNRLYVFCDKVTGTNYTAGTVVAVFNASTLAYERTDSLPGKDVINSLVRVSGGWWGLATYATPSQQDAVFIPAADLATPSAWQWHYDAIPASQRPGTVVSMTHGPSGWVAFTKLGDAYGSNEIERLTATTPSGPWTADGTWTITPPASGEVTYSVQAHPTLSAPAGDMLVSYAVNGGADADYHLHFLDLPLAGS